MSGTYHPPGCRCPGCLPAQYVMRPASPARRPPARQQPVRGGGWADAGIYGIGLILLVAACAGFWPVMVWHGHGGPTGNDWRWDIHSTIAEGVYLGSLGFIGFLAWLGNRPVKPPKGRLNVEATAPADPPACLHRNAVPVDNDTLGRLAYWCPDCETRLDPAGFRSAELSPDASWPPVRLHG